MTVIITLGKSTHSALLSNWA